MAGVTTGNRALKGRASRKLPSIELPRSQDHSINRAFENIAEYLRTYEGDGTAPKERFVTMRELEEAGLVTLGTKNGYSFIAQVLKKDVAQTAGSTANPTLKGTIKKDTALGLRTPGGGGGGAGNPIEQGKRGITQKLSDIGNVAVASPAQADFLYYDGGKWKNYSLFKRENRWLKKQNFAAGIALEGTDFDPADYALATHTHVIADITDFTDNSTNWDTAYGWGDHSVENYAVTTGDTFTGILAIEMAGVQLRFTETDAAVDNKNWLLYTNSAQMSLRAYNDGWVASNNIITFSRSGTTAGNVTVAADLVTGGNVRAASNFYPGGQTVGLVEAVSGNYGSVQCDGGDGSSGTWEGWSIDGRAVFMWHPTEERGGIYDDVNNRWAIQWNPANASANEPLYLYNGSTDVFQTQQYTATGKTSGAITRRHGGAYADVGFNVLPTFNFNASDTLEAQHCGAATGKTNTSSYTLTGPTSSNLDFPVGGVCTVMNLGTSTNYTINDTTTCTMRIIDGSSVTDIAGSCTLAPGGVCTLYRYSASAIYLFGSGLTP